MGKGWYIVQTYAGYEQRIVDTINKLRRRDEDFAKVCTGVDLPVEEATVKNEKNEVKTVYNKILPGYILVELDFSEGDWKPSYSKVVGINGVSGFLGADRSGMKAPKALSSEEYKRIMSRTGRVPDEKKFRPVVEFSLGEEVCITAGPFNTFNGVIDEIDKQKGRLKLSIQIFGRSTPVEVDFNQVEKVLP